MNFWNALIYIDLILFILMAFPVLYMTVFTIAGLFNRHSKVKKTRHQNRFIVLIPVYRGGKDVELTVSSALGQTYPQRMFDVTVISDHSDEITNFRLAQHPITLLTPNFEKSSKLKSIQLALNNLPQFKIYDIVVVLDAGNIVEPEFLEQMNEAFESAGTKAIQAHRLSKNRDTASARLDAIFEEINNTIFRRGHITLGLSAATAGSGTAYDFQWFKSNALALNAMAESKELEALLMRQHIYVDYFDHILVFDEKTRRAEDFNRQRSRWAFTQYKTLLRNIKYLPIALVNRQYDLVDKIIQWMLVPRMIMMAVIVFMCVALPFIYFRLCLKWWALFAFVLFIFALATPDYLVDKKWNGTFFRSPFILLKSVPGASKMAEKLRATKFFAKI